MFAGGVGLNCKYGQLSQKFFVGRLIREYY